MTHFSASEGVSIFFCLGLNDPSAPYGACEGLYMVKVRIRGGGVVYGADWLCLG